MILDSHQHFWRVGAFDYPWLSPRLGVLYGTDDGWFRDPAARELLEKVRAGGGRVWVIQGRHVDLSPSGLAARLPIYVDFVDERTP